jgi:hypothetical protein
MAARPIKLAPFVSRVDQTATPVHEYAAAILGARVRGSDFRT